MKVLFLFLPAFLAAASAPRLEWYKSIPGSGASTAVAVATDPLGNLYITGHTTSLDLPVTSSALQSNPGGSPLLRIDTASGASRNLYSPAIAALQTIAADPENPQILYAATPNTLLRSTDAGNTFAALTNFPAVNAIGAIAVDPTNSNNLYVATNPLGALKSIDGGITWTAINNGIPLTNNQGVSVYGFASTFTTLDVSRIWIDPKSPSILFAQVFSYTNSGLYRSTDGGATWAQSLGGVFFVGSLSFDPFTPGTLYTQGYKSTDEGLNWAPIGSPVGPVTPDPLHQGTLYLAAYNGVFQSTDSGATWTLKVHGNASLITADPKGQVIYSYVSPLGLIRSTDGFSTYAVFGSLATMPNQLLVAGAYLFAGNPPTTDVFLTKLDPAGNLLYSTYIGGSSNDSPAAVVAAPDGSVYLAGRTSSADFPITANAYSTHFPGISSNFLLKVNPDGSLAWSTYFADQQSTVNALALDAAGNIHLAGASYGNLPVTPGAYQPQFPPVGCSFFCFTYSVAFYAKFNADASALTACSYIATTPAGNFIQTVNSIAVDSKGNAYLGGNYAVLEISGDASKLLASTLNSLTTNALALDAAGNLYAAGSTNSSTPFPATSGAFQTSPQPAVPSLPDQGTAGGPSDAFVVKFAPGLTQVLAATLLGGESTDAANSISIDPVSGNIIVGGYTDSRAFPTRAPFQGPFAPRSGFVAAFDPTLAQLLYSTYLGGPPSFAAAGAVPDGNGNILLAGSTLARNPGDYLINDAGFPYMTGQTVVANKIALPAAPAVRLDSVVNFASQLAAPLAPGEAIAAIGSGFGPKDQIVVDGTPLPSFSNSPNRIVAVLPGTFPSSGPHQFAVSSSNTIQMPSAPAAPAIYSVDGSGFNQGYILNADGTPNSPSNPTSAGSPVTLFVNGAGNSPDASVAVFIDGFYANGISSSLGPVPGFPGNVYKISVYVPGYIALPTQVPATIFIGAVNSQTGLALSVK